MDVLNLENVVGPDLDHFSKIRRPNFPAGLVGSRAGGEGRWEVGHTFSWSGVSSMNRVWSVECGVYQILLRLLTIFLTSDITQQLNIIESWEFSPPGIFSDSQLTSVKEGKMSIFQQQFLEPARFSVLFNTARLNGSK